MGHAGKDQPLEDNRLGNPKETMKKCNFSNTVSETLLITLYMRAKESRRGAKAILHDSWAEKLVGQIDYDFSSLDQARLSEIGCVVRSWYFDRAVRRFISCHRHPVVVNVGCGFDTRAQRIGSSGRAIFYEVDLPDVIAGRRGLIPETSDDRYLEGSILESSWMDELSARHPHGDFIFVVEGVFMYFYESQIREFLHHVSCRFGGAELWFDVCGSARVKPDSLRSHHAEVRSGIDDGRQLESWVPGLKLLEQSSYMQHFRSRWGFFCGQVLGRLPMISRRYCSLLGYRIDTEESLSQAD